MCVSEGVGEGKGKGTGGMIHLCQTVCDGRWGEEVGGVGAGKVSHLF